METLNGQCALESMACRARTIIHDRNSELREHVAVAPHTRGWPRYRQRVTADDGTVGVPQRRNQRLDALCLIARPEQVELDVMIDAGGRQYGADLVPQIQRNRAGQDADIEIQGAQLRRHDWPTSARRRE